MRRICLRHNLPITRAVRRTARKKGWVNHVGCAECFREYSRCEHCSRKFVCWYCSPNGWARNVLRNQRKNAHAGHFAPPDITPEALVKLRRQAEQSRCCWFSLCNCELNWSSGDSPDLHHDHGTGEVYGFVHHRCNQFLGHLEELPGVADLLEVIQQEDK